MEADSGGAEGPVLQVAAVFWVEQSACCESEGTDALDARIPRGLQTRRPTGSSTTLLLLTVHLLILNITYNANNTFATLLIHK